MYRLLVVAALSLVCTTQAMAAVSISEVAWMGSLASANHEWIELYNDGEAVSVSGWTLSDGMNLTVTLEGNIAASSYAVLERSSDASAPGTAFVIYTGALVNTGATLTLRDSSGGIIDQVVGGSDWQNIGGDNVTKETAQYTTAGWVTDEATPGAVNRSGRSVPPPEEENETVATTSTNTTTNNSNTSRSRNRSSTVRLQNPETHMTLSADIQRVAYVNQTIDFSVSARGNYEGPESMVRFYWNFGDGHATSGRWVEHSYQYPGEYVVTVHGKNGRTDETMRAEITVLPVTFSLSTNAAGDVLIHNDAQYDVDISAYTVRGTKAFVFPPRTVMVARGTITLPEEFIGDSQQLIALYDAKGALVTSTFARLFSTPNVPTPAAEVKPPVAGAATVPAPSFTFGATPALAAEPAVAEVITVPAQVGGAPAAPLSARVWYFLFALFFSVVFLAILFIPRTPPA